jgi:hypothetical protein
MSSAPYADPPTRGNDQASRSKSHPIAYTHRRVQPTRAGHHRLAAVGKFERSLSLGQMRPCATPFAAVQTEQHWTRRLEQMLARVIHTLCRAENISHHIEQMSRCTVPNGRRCLFASRFRYSTPVTPHAISARAECRVLIKAP